ncbi:MAG: hypothetical protein ABI779_20875 [Acidobacteriota bacterium]
MKRFLLAVLVLASFTPIASARQRAMHHPAERCSFSLVPVWGTPPVPATGLQRGAVLVYGQTALCAQWMSYSDVDWVTVESAPLDAQPSAYVTIAPNVLPVARATSLTIAGVRLEVSQEAAPALQNPSLVKNGTFDTNIDHWGWQEPFQNGFGAASWSTLDANGSPSSGSLLMQDESPGLAFQRLQCVPVAKSTPYRFGAKVRTGSDNAHGYAILAIFSYREADCSGTFTNQAIYNLRPESPGVWQEFSFSTITGSPTKAILVVVGSAAEQFTFDTWFDDVFVTP